MLPGQSLDETCVQLLVNLHKKAATTIQQNERTKRPQFQFHSVSARKICRKFQKKKKLTVDLPVKKIRRDRRDFCSLHAGPPPAGGTTVANGGVWPDECGCLKFTGRQAVGPAGQSGFISS